MGQCIKVDVLFIFLWDCREPIGILWLVVRGCCCIGVGVVCSWVDYVFKLSLRFNILSAEQLHCVVLLKVLSYNLSQVHGAIGVGFKYLRIIE